MSRTRYCNSPLTSLVNVAVKMDKACRGVITATGNGTSMWKEANLINHSTLSTCFRIRARKSSNSSAHVKQRNDLSGLSAKEMSQCGWYLVDTHTQCDDNPLWRSCYKSTLVCRHHSARLELLLIRNLKIPLHLGRLSERYIILVHTGAEWTQDWRPAGALWLPPQQGLVCV